MPTFLRGATPPRDPAQDTAVATFGPQSPRRDGGGALPTRAARAYPGEHADAADTPCWVDQDFEEMVFE